jgi:hypothetical protein
MAVTELTPNQIARSIGVTGLQFRNWLRAQKAAGHPLLVGHEHRSRYGFTRIESDRLASEFRSGAAAGPASRRSRRASSGPAAATRESGEAQTASDDPFADLAMSREPGHRVAEEWMGASVLTLGDLLRPGLYAVVVGINPSPVSVAAGHYYQGQIGQRFFKRLH